MDDEKATVKVGFKNPIQKEKEPTIVSVTAKSTFATGRYNDSYNPVFYVTYDGAENFYPFDLEIITTGTVTAVAEVSKIDDKTREIMLRDKKYVGIQGEGTVQIHIKPGSASNGENLSEAFESKGAYSPVVVVDNTYPVIKLNGSSSITVEQGEEYVELGATVTDNIDTEIEKSLIINSSEVNTNQIGTYKVYYNATDQAGNKAF